MLPPMMDGWRKSPKALAVMVTIAMGLSLLAGLSGCGNEESPLRYVIEAVRGDPYALSGAGTEELGRFNAVYSQYAVRQSGDKQLNHFRDAFKLARAKYVSEISDAKLIDAAIKGVNELKAEPHSLQPPVLVEAALDAMMASLDPHSRYLNPDELRETQLATKGEFGGLGIEVTLEDETLKVIAPIEDPPAFAAGIKAKDTITHLDGDPIKGKTLTYAVGRMRGKPGSEIRLTIAREGASPFDVTIIRAVIKVKSVRWQTEGNVGYIRVTGFNENVEINVEKAMADISLKTGARLKGIVLDLRNNPGGLLMESVALSDLFLDKGRIVSVLGRGGPESDRVYTARSGDLASGLPMVVLIDGGSASASEIVAGALQDHRRATVMGRRSFGKGSVQTITPLSMEGALKLTTQLYYSPSGRAIQARGVEPDILFSVKDEEAAKDGRHEADLAGALPAVSASPAHSRIVVDEKECPPVANKNEKADHQLGCAIALLSAESQEKFLASFGARHSM